MFFPSQKEKIFFAEHLYLMIKGGMSLIEALRILKSEVQSRYFKKALEDMSKKILEGSSLSGSMDRHPKIFSKFFRSIIKIGEESGTLEENLKYLSSFLENNYSLRKKVIGALIYPVLIIIVALIIVTAVVFFILPKLMDLFTALNIELPLATRVLLGSSAFLQNYWFLILGGTFFFFLIWNIAGKIRFVRFYLHKISFYYPIFGKVIINRNLAEFSRTFAILLKSGVPITEALNICIETSDNEVFKKSLVSVRSGVERGEKISRGLKRSPEIFSHIFSQMVLVGENSGSLEESFFYLAEFHEKEVNSTLKNLTVLLEPLMLILLGFFVVFIALAIITPIYQFTGNLKVR